MDEDLIVLMVTTGSGDAAREIADALLEARLVACANLVPQVHSRYWWQGERESAEEVVLVAKTRRALFDRAVAVVRAHHSYEVFEALAVPIVACEPAYAAWVLETTAPAMEAA